MARGNDTESHRDLTGFAHCKKTSKAHNRQAAWIATSQHNHQAPGAH